MEPHEGIEVHGIEPQVIGRLVDQDGTSKDSVIDMQVTSAACPRNHRYLHP